MSGFDKLKQSLNSPNAELTEQIENQSFEEMLTLLVSSGIYDAESAKSIAESYLKILQENKENPEEVDSELVEYLKKDLGNVHRDSYLYFYKLALMVLQTRKSK